ncbi:MAG: hypothetical protein FAF04_08260 [Epsilonproteobacteria bacterium]|nr:hypothetical protein [Campylobacterota bacterium]
MIEEFKKMIFDTNEEIILMGLLPDNYSVTDILFVTGLFIILIVISRRKEFAGFREWLDRKFGWLF